MKYCNTCATERSWPKTFTQEITKCGVCGECAYCSDVQTEILPVATPPPTAALRAEKGLEDGPYDDGVSSV